MFWPLFFMLLGIGLGAGVYALRWWVFRWGAQRVEAEYQTLKTMDFQETDPLLTQFDAESVGVLYFTADWCAPCKTMQRPMLDALQAKRPDLQVVTVDIDEHQEAMQRWNVMSVPRTVVIAPGRRVYATNMDVTQTAILDHQLDIALTSDPDTPPQVYRQGDTSEQANKLKLGVR